MRRRETKIWSLLFVALTGMGCPLEDDPTKDVAPANSTANTGDQNSSDNTTGSDNTDSPDANVDPDTNNSGDADAGLTRNDAGSTVDPVMDAGGGTGGDTNTTGEDIDASTTGGDFDAGTTGTEVVDAGQAAVDAGQPVVDAGQPVVDAGQPVVDAGQPVVAPDLGAADMPDADRVTLIYNLLQSEGYVDNWYPFLQSNGDQRALLVTPSHGNEVRVRQNPVAKVATDAWVDDGLPLPLDMPNGSIVVKDTYKLDAVSGAMAFNGSLIMAKIDALDPTVYEGNWFFVRTTAANVASRGTTCIGCHNGRLAKTVWPADPAVVGDPGGKADALVPYDNLFIPFCYDPQTAQCAAPP